MALFLVVIALLLSAGAVAAGLTLLHHAAVNASDLVRWSGRLLVLAGAAAAVVTVRAALQFERAGEFKPGQYQRPVRPLAPMRPDMRPIPQPESAPPRDDSSANSGRDSAETPTWDGPRTEPRRPREDRPMRPDPRRFGEHPFFGGEGAPDRR